MAEPKTGLYIYGQNKLYDPSKEMDILKFNNWAENNPKSAAKYGAKGGLFNGSTSVNGAPNTGLTPSTGITPTTSNTASIDPTARQLLELLENPSPLPKGYIAQDYQTDFNVPNSSLINNPAKKYTLESDVANNMGLGAGEYTGQEIQTAADNYNNFMDLTPGEQSAFAAAGATFDAKNNISGVDYSKLNNFFNTDGTVDMDKFTLWARSNPEAAAGFGGSLTFDNNNIGRFNGLTPEKSNTFLGLGNEAWGNVLKGGGLVLQGIGLSDQLKTNKKQREAMDFDLLAARGEKAALDKYRAAYA